MGGVNSDDLGAAASQQEREYACSAADVQHSLRIELLGEPEVGVQIAAFGIERVVRRRLAQDGPPWTRDREADFETVTVPERDCDQLRDLLISEGAQTVVEVGLAYASSALAIGEALVTVNPPRPRHVIIDPFQERDWSNAGWGLLRAAGLDSIASLMLAPSSIALPQLIAEGLAADAAFVDSSHRFHEVFVDLYFLRKIVRPGGLIVIDDAWAPSVLTAVHYYERNLGWTVVPDPRPWRARGCLGHGQLASAAGIGPAADQTTLPAQR